MSPVEEGPGRGLRLGADGVVRCAWAGSAPEYLAYHDDEWGRPVHGERALFERITLEAFQSGLSWLTILRKRDGFRPPSPASTPTSSPHTALRTRRACWLTRPSSGTGPRSPPP